MSKRNHCPRTPAEVGVGSGLVPSEHYDAVVVASSAGGVHALGVLLSALGDDFAVPVLVVQHVHRRHATLLPQVLARRSRLVVKLAEHHELALARTVYVAPPDRHLLVGPGGVLMLSHSEPVRFLRPCADHLFTSAAGVYGPGVIACVLTGTGRDGAQGVDAVKSRGGTVLVQDPATAAFPGMPDAAIATGSADLVLPLEQIGAALHGLVPDRDEVTRALGERGRGGECHRIGTSPVIAVPIELSCGACPHAWESDDRIGGRYCSATMTRGLDRECACARPADHENTYYR